MIEPIAFRSRVVAPVLRFIELWSPAAEVLVFGTAIIESRLSALVQVGGGPALGVYQIEPFTHNDIRQNFLLGRPTLATKVDHFRSPQDSVEQLLTNLAYATAICRVKYFRSPLALPNENDAEGLGAYWKIIYNTSAGAGRASDAALTFRHILAGGPL